MVVCDQIGGMAYDAGVLGYYADARKRLLAPDGVLVPGSFTLQAAPVAAGVWNDTVAIWSSKPAGLDLGPMADMAANTMLGCEIASGEFSLP